jgi:hypothetical protein
MLNNIRIASPCPADWEKMAGNERVRHCQACNLDVYNFSTWTEREIRSLLAGKKEDRLCARLYQRRDGTVLTQNCPVGVRALTHRLSRIAGAVLSFMMPGLVGAQRALGQSYTTTNTADAVLQLEVFDRSGSRVSNATATLMDTSRGIQREAKAGKDGRLVVRGPVGGHYTLRVSSPGFRVDVRKVELRGGQLISLPVRLDVSAMVGVVELVEPGSHPDSRTVPLTVVSAASRLSPKPVQH